MLRRNKRPFWALVSLGILASPARAAATGFTDQALPERARDKIEFELHGDARTRLEVLSNLDLDRGASPSGQSFFPIPAGGGKSMFYGDMRVRTDFAAYALGGGVAVKGRIDLLDDVPFGSDPQGIPSASTSQLTSGSAAFRIKRAWGEARTPIGVLAAGRMGNAWGLGMLANGGDCADCDSGDAADRVAFVTPLAGHIWAVAYDLGWVGPTQWRNDDIRRIGWAPSTQVHNVTFAFLRWHDDFSRVRRTKAGKITFDYGAYVSHRWQTDDSPYDYVPIAIDARPTSSVISARGFSATALDGWARFLAPGVRIELEAAILLGTVSQPSLIPGFAYNTSVTSRQVGLAIESDFGGEDDVFSAGLDGGYASGNPAPGFGISQSPNPPNAKVGDLFGNQIDPPRQTHADAFRFHPDYRIDRILFRELIGTVTDAIYVRPHARFDLAKLGTGTLRASISAMYAVAAQPDYTPAAKGPLGIEIDPTLAYGSHDGFAIALEYAALFPLAGLDNPQAGLQAHPAQLFRIRLNYVF
jgi:uncharacterized protein (TIGR04551 family)